MKNLLLIGNSIINLKKVRYISWQPGGMYKDENPPGVNFTFKGHQVVFIQITRKQYADLIMKLHTLKIEGV